MTQIEGRGIDESDGLVEWERHLTGHSLESSSTKRLP